jgi:hypothetical protein
MKYEILHKLIGIEMRLLFLYEVTGSEIDGFIGLLRVKKNSMKNINKPY